MPRVSTTTQFEGGVAFELPHDVVGQSCADHRSCARNRALHSALAAKEWSKGAKKYLNILVTLRTFYACSKVGAVDVSKSLPSTCERLCKEFGSDRILSLPCDVTDKTSLVRVCVKSDQLCCSINGFSCRPKCSRKRRKSLASLTLLSTMLG